MDTRQLRHFVALAETLNYHRASERLHMAQPPLSTSIRKLEEQLGVRLFERDKRGTRLAPAGEAALHDARQALFHAEQFGRTAQAAASGAAGTVRLGFVGSATYACMPALIPVFRQKYPGIRLQLMESTTQSILQALEAGEMDVGLLRSPVLRAHALSITPLEHDVFQLALPLAHPLAKQRSIELAALADEAFILYGEQQVPSLHAMAMLACQRAGFSPQVQQEATQVQTIVSLVESGLGIALVPSVARKHANHQVLLKPLRGPGSEVEIGIALAWRPGQETPAAQVLRQSFIAHSLALPSAAPLRKRR